MELKDFAFDGSEELKLDKLPTGAADKIKADKSSIVEATMDNVQIMGELQDKLYADGKEGLVIVIQAMDAAGKDSAVKHVMSGLNPQGIDVHSFKQPSSEELSHDFMWRAMKCMPVRGKIAIFNRSYYEDVLVVKVHDLYKNYKLPDRCIGMDKDKFFNNRYKQLKDMEEYYYDNGYRFIKIFLNVSKDEQKKRFLERIDTPAKNWKFSEADIKERGYWGDYMRAYEDAVNATATKHNPWYVLPADNKWYARYLISQIITDTLKDMNPAYPVMPKEKTAELQSCKQELLDEE